MDLWSISLFLFIKGSCLWHLLTYFQGEVSHLNKWYRKSHTTLLCYCLNAQISKQLAIFIFIACIICLIFLMLVIFCMFHACVYIWGSLIIIYFMIRSEHNKCESQNLKSCHHARWLVLLSTDLYYLTWFWY